MNTLRKTKSILNKYGIRANKRFGQNFLIDDNILENIVSVSDVSKNDLVIEIGPGLGNLTEYIIEKAGYMLLVEIDNNMINILNDRFTKYNNYTLLNKDILKINIDEQINKIEDSIGKKFSNIKVVANLPYYITTPIIFKLLQDENRINKITVMVQKEVAERMVAKSNTKDYGILTLMVKYLSNANIEFIVPREAFIPPPNVTSAIINLKKVKNYTVKDEKLFFEFIHSSFAQRRKTMINSLSSTKFNNFNKEKLNSLFDKLNIDKNTRAEQLEIEDYIRISDGFVLCEQNVDKSSEM